MGTTRVFRVETETHWEEREGEDMSVKFHTFFVQAFNHFDAESKAVAMLTRMYPVANWAGKFVAEAKLDNPRDLEREEETVEDLWAEMEGTVSSEEVERAMGQGGDYGESVTALGVDVGHDLRIEYRDGDRIDVRTLESGQILTGNLKGTFISLVEGEGYPKRIVANIRVWGEKVEVIS